jgi:hypothetical protein
MDSLYASPDDKPKKKRKRRKKKLGRAPRHIVPLKNADKKAHEVWKKGQNLARFPHPFRCCILGSVNSGKSLLAKHILLAHQQSKPKFQQLIICHGDRETKEYDDLDPDEITDQIPHHEDLDPDTKKLIIIDDFDFSRNDPVLIERISNLFRHGSTHRSTSIILCHQSPVRGVPKIARDCSNVFIVFKPHDTDTLTTVGRRIGLKKEEIVGVFKDVLPHWRDSLCCDLSPNSPAKYRKNIFQPIKVVAEDDSVDEEGG